MKIKERYESLKNCEYDKLDPVDQLIFDCYKYKIFSDKVSDHKWFETAFKHKYPENVDDLSKKLCSSLRSAIKERKKDEAFEEKMKMQRYERGFSDCDSWNIYSWFMEVMTPALKKMRKDLHGFPDGVNSSCYLISQAVVLDKNEKESEGMKQWEAVLDRMIFLLEEMNEDTCEFENPYEKEVNKARREFEKKYGLFGEHFEEKTGTKDETGKSGKRIYFFSDDPDHPEWKELNANWRTYEMAKASYRDRCKEEFFKLFSTWFWDLWD